MTASSASAKRVIRDRCRLAVCAAAVVVIALLAALVPAGQAEAAPKNCPYDIRCSIMYNYLTEPQRALVDEMYDAIYTGADKVEFTNGLGDGVSDDELWWLLDFVWNEYPELCAYDKATTNILGWDTDAGWERAWIAIGYRSDVSIADQRRFIDQMSGTAAQFKGKSAADGISAIYDYVCNRFAYEYNWDPSFDTQFSYYACQQNEALCNGYAQTINLLCHLAGYDCSYVDGQAGDPGDTGAHAWNVFAAGGKLFWGDATWDDFRSERRYYNATLDFMEQDHFADGEYSVLPRSGVFSKRASAARFSDVPYGSWFYDWVYAAARAGTMTGYNGVDLFGPDDSVLRGQVATVLWRAAGSPTVQYSGVFSDVPSGQYYSNAVIWCYQNKIVTGYAGTGRFGPDNVVTREQLATMIYRYASYRGADMTANPTVFNGIRGTNAVSSWARAAMVWCADKGIVTGANRNGASYADPQERATRAQMSKIVTVTMRDVIG